MKIEKLEKMNREFMGLDFVKSYPVLTFTDLTPQQIRLLQLVLSYKSNKQEFQMYYLTIADLIGVKGIKNKTREKSVGNSVGKLIDKGIMTSKCIRNFKVESSGGGSKAYLTVNEDALYAYIQPFLDDKTKQEIPTKRVKEPEPAEDISTVEVTQNQAEVVETTKEDIPTKPVNVEPKEDEDLSHIIFENFNVRDTLRRYVDKEDSINMLYDAFTKYRLKEHITIYTLTDLACCISDNYGQSNEGRNLAIKIIEDLEKIGEFKRDKAA